jgi:hypothetical protein
VAHLIKVNNSIFISINELKFVKHNNLEDFRVLYIKFLYSGYILANSTGRRGLVSHLNTRYSTLSKYIVLNLLLS